MKAEELRNKFAKAIKALDEAKQMEMEQYANQRVIEELEEIKIRLSKKSFSEHCVEEVDNRIKELKQ